MTEKFWQGRPLTPEEEKQTALYQQRVQSIADLLELPLDACEEEIDRALEEMGEAIGNADFFTWCTKQTKRDLGKLHLALKNATIAYAALPASMRQISLPPLDLQQHIECCERILNYGAGDAKRAAPVKQRQAAVEARALLRHIRLPCRANRGGKWCKLAALLYGDPAADLYPYCQKMV